METLPLIDDGKTHTVHLGETFKKNSHAAFHTVRLDFKPASVDVNQPGKVVVTDKHQVEIVLPHQQNSKNANTVYRGSTKAVQKECVLIIDPQTGHLTLERINSQIQAKKIRLAPGSSHLTSTNIPPAPPQQQPPQSVQPQPNQGMKKPKSIQGKKPTQQQQTIKLPTKVINPSPTSAFVPATTHKSHDIQMPTSRIEDYVKDVEEEDGGELQPDELLENIANLSDSGSDSSSSSSSSSSDSDDDDDDDQGITSPMTPNTVPETTPVKTNENLLDLDLELTSDSDSDSN